MKAIVAINTQEVIGRDGDLPWHLPEDLKRFRELTLTGNLVLLGRKTFESLPFVLPGRDHFVLSRRSSQQIIYPKRHKKTKGEVVSVLDFNELKEYEHLLKSNKTWLIGGREIYILLAKWVDELYETVVFDSSKKPGDVLFPRGSYTDLVLEECSEIMLSKTGLNYMFNIYRRKNV